MTRRVRAALLAALLAGCAAASEPSTLPPFALSDQSGQTVRSEDLRGRAVIVSFIFTTCVEACPILTAQLVRAQARARADGLADRVRFVSITVDPVTDTPPRLKRYAEGFGVDLTTWSFLTGPPEEIARVMNALEVTSASGARGLAHDTPVLFVDAAGRVVERHRDVELTPEAAVAKLKKLLS